MKRILISLAVLMLHVLFMSADDDFTLPRPGPAASVSPGYENVTWYGRGPDENYEDREAASWFGIFGDTVDGIRENYARTQTWVTVERYTGCPLPMTRDMELSLLLRSSV